MIFTDRQQAGHLLAERLREPAASHPHEHDRPATPWPGQDADPLILALPRGGVPVAAAVAGVLRVPLDILVARKIGVPGHPEAAVGAVAGEDPPLFHQGVLQYLDMSEDELAPDVERERAEVHRREQLYREGRPAPRIAGRTVLVIDDGLATGMTALAALRHVRRNEPAHLTLAAPVASDDAADTLAKEADEVVVLQEPPEFRSVGEWYEEFPQVSDDQVMALLRPSSAAA